MCFLCGSANGESIDTEYNEVMHLPTCGKHENYMTCVNTIIYILKDHVRKIVTNHRGVRIHTKSYVLAVEYLNKPNQVDLHMHKSGKHKLYQMHYPSQNMTGVISVYLDAIGALEQHSRL